RSDLPKVLDNRKGEKQDSNQQSASQALLEDSHNIVKNGDGAKNDNVEGYIGKQIEGNKINDLVYRPNDDGWRSISVKDPSKEEIQRAEDKLDNKLSPLVSDADRKLEQQITH